MNMQGRLYSYHQPVVMGILNTTPDSFYDGGKHRQTSTALEKARMMAEEGADMIDIGGYSSRPGADPVSENTETARVIPAIRAIRDELPELPISIDTFRANVARKALEAGANMVNDISSGDDDPEMFPFIAEARPPYIIMHKQGTPQSMQDSPAYDDVNKDILRYFSEKTDALHQLGISDIIIDPGFGFGKTVEHNYEILKHLYLYKTFGLPVLAGMSRKSMINKVLGTTPETALNGTTVVNTLALMHGCDILRVHDVREARETIKICTRL